MLQKIKGPILTIISISSSFTYFYSLNKKEVFLTGVLYTAVTDTFLTQFKIF